MNDQLGDLGDLGPVVIHGEVILPSTKRAKWAARINASWRKSLDGIFETGRLIAAAKDDLDHGEFIPMIESDLTFGKRAAQALMQITARFAQAQFTAHLPPAWATLAKLAPMDDEEIEDLIEERVIHPGMKQGDITKFLRLAKVAEDEQRILKLKPVAGKFRTVVLDPAWEYSWLSIAGRAKPGYAMQTHEQLRALDVAAWADDGGCHLYLWTTNNFMARACELVAHWGFQHRTLITWIKPPPFGLGSYFRNSTEHALFATRGETTTRHAAASIPTHFEAPRGEHSEKPERFYEIVRASSYPPYGEGNQRQARRDFTDLFE